MIRSVVIVVCVVAVDSVSSDFKTARLLLSHYGFLNLEGLKVAVCFLFIFIFHLHLIPLC